MKAYHIDQYPAKTSQAKAIMHMIMNTLDPNVAQFPLNNLWWKRKCFLKLDSVSFDYALFIRND